MIGGRFFSMIFKGEGGLQMGLVGPELLCAFNCRFEEFNVI